MNRYKPVFGIEPTNKYDKAKQDLIQALNSYQALNQQEKKMLVEEFFGAANIAALTNILNRTVGR